MFLGPNRLKIWQLAIAGVFLAALAANGYLSSEYDGRWPMLLVGVALLALMESLCRVGVLPPRNPNDLIFENQSALIAAFVCELVAVAWVRVGLPLLPDTPARTVLIYAPLLVLKIGFWWLIWVSVRKGYLAGLIWRRR